LLVLRDIGGDRIQHELVKKRNEVCIGENGGAAKYMSAQNSLRDASHASPTHVTDTRLKITVISISIPNSIFYSTKSVQEKCSKVDSVSQLFSASAEFILVTACFIFNS
jgi:hypothetical protein